MTGNPIEQYSVDEVAVWLNGIGISAAETERFKENAIDGKMLVGLTEAELQNDLRLPHLHAKKALTELKANKNMASAPPETAPAHNADAHPHEHQVSEGVATAGLTALGAARGALAGVACGGGTDIGEMAAYGAMAGGRRKHRPRGLIRRLLAQ